MLKKVTPFIIEKEMLSGRVSDVAQVRDEILKRLEAEPLDIILPLNFSKVRFIDFSASDEIVCRVIRRILSGELGERYIILNELAESLKENIHVALKERELVCSFVHTDFSVEVLGKISDELKTTYLKTVQKGKISARDVFESESLQNISAASNRLTRLKDMGLLTKSKDEVVAGGGRQFIYEPIR